MSPAADNVASSSTVHISTSELLQELSRSSRKRTLAQVYADSAEAALQQRLAKLARQPAGPQLSKKEKRRRKKEEDARRRAEHRGDKQVQTSSEAMQALQNSSAGLKIDTASTPVAAAADAQALKKAKGIAKAQAAKSLGNRDLTLRTQHLFRAAAYLKSIGTRLQSRHTTQAEHESSIAPPDSDVMQTSDEKMDTASSFGELNGLVARYVSDLKGVARKAQLKLPIPLKRRVCKRCDNLLVDDGVTLEVLDPRRSTATAGESAATTRQGDARLLVMTCARCGAKKHFPLRKGLPEVASITDRHTASTRG